LLASSAFALPIGLVLCRMGVVIGAPIRLLALLGFPARTGRIQLGLLRCPVGGIDGAPFARHRSAIQRGGACQVTPGIIGMQIHFARRQQAALAVIHRHQIAIGIAIGKVGIAHQIRLAGAGTIIIIAMAAIHRLDHLL
jgi:hypothetical protein